MDEEVKQPIIGTPWGYEDSVERGPGGWAVWKKPRDGSTRVCAGEDCTAVYAEDPDDRVHALMCPQCEAVGCEECIMPMGRSCICVNCEEG